MSEICTENYSWILNIKILIMYQYREFEDLWRLITDQFLILIPTESIKKHQKDCLIRSGGMRTSSFWVRYCAFEYFCWHSSNLLNISSCIKACEGDIWKADFWGKKPQVHLTIVREWPKISAPHLPSPNF